MYTYSYITSCINPRQISGTWPSTFVVILECSADWLSFQNSKYNNTIFGKYGYSQSSNKTWLNCEITNKNRKSERNTVRENLFFKEIVKCKLFKKKKLKHTCFRSCSDKVRLTNGPGEYDKNSKLHIGIWKCC